VVPRRIAARNPHKTLQKNTGWSSATEYCGWTWDPTPFWKRLRFQTDQLAVEVWADVYDLSKEDFIALVKGLK
jgi:hypothetical protein